MSRFDKLERDRKKGEAASAESSSGASLERFEGGPAEREAPGPDAPQPVASSLARFESDGKDTPRLADDALVELPMLRCPACLKDSGKFEKNCHACGASFDSPEARKLNQSLAARVKADREGELRARETAHGQSVVEAAAQEVAKRDALEAWVRGNYRRVGSQPTKLGRVLLVAAVFFLWEALRFGGRASTYPSRSSTFPERYSTVALVLAAVVLGVAGLPRTVKRWLRDVLPFGRRRQP